jgi:aryl-alcohol dehydrogenase-like predicted oxidoreductase
MHLSRRDLLRLGAGTAAVAALTRLPAFGAQAPAASAAPALLTKPIPKTGERLPLIGVGTLGAGYQTPTAESRAQIRATFEAFVAGGAKVIDTAPAYGGSEELIGGLLEELKMRDKIFLATKIGTGDGPAAAQAIIENSFAKLRVPRLDLLAVHSLNGWETSLPLLRELKASGRIRYLGITTSRTPNNDTLEKIMKTEDLDVVQVTYAVDDRDVDRSLLKTAQDRGMAVWTNLSLGRGRLLQRVANVKLPEWAAEIDCTTWPQFFLKYVVSHPAVTCAIPGMSKAEHFADNIKAAQGRQPDAATRRRMEQFIDALPA